jgi:DNA-binding transcriptional LysR family regulator
MQGFRHAIPSADALVVFEAAARQLSFTLAARELSVTQAAVSRRIRALEQALDFELFKRDHKALQLTTEGQELFEAVSTSLRHILETAQRLRSRRDQATVTIAANNAVAFLWLRPRVAAFMNAHPDVEVQLVASDRPQGFDEGGHDLAIRYGQGRWGDAEAELLFEEVNFPVCAPGYLRGRPAPVGVDDLNAETLLHIMPRGPDWITWASLIEGLGGDVSPAVEQGPRFNNYPILLQAALDGQGMAIGTAHLLDEHLARGDLIRPLPDTLSTGRGYYLVAPSGRRQAPAVERLAAWLTEGPTGRSS